MILALDYQETHSEIVVVVVEELVAAALLLQLVAFVAFVDSVDVAFGAVAEVEVEVDAEDVFGGVDDVALSLSLKLLTMWIAIVVVVVVVVRHFYDFS